MTQDKRILKILTKSADACGWAFRGCLENWDHGGHVSNRPKYDWGSFPAQAMPPDQCTFWFHLKDDENSIVGFDWEASKPDVIRTINGSLPTTTPINFSYVSSHKKLTNFFNTSKKQYQTLPQPKKSIFRSILNWI